MLRQPTQSFQNLRYFMEKWSWIDPATGYRTTGYNPPSAATGKQQVPCYIRYVTGKGRLECGNVICLKTFPRLHQRLVKFIQSGECRRIRDYLVIEVDGTRIITH